jgi:phosphatidylinositol glycan class O
MDNGEPLPSFDAIAAAFAKAKAEKEKQEPQGLKPRTGDAEKANKAGEVHFKAAHGIIIAFFTWILYIGPRVLWLRGTR